jgi:tetratricopeptide (TPR) repeat protein
MLIMSNLPKSFYKSQIKELNYKGVQLHNKGLFSLALNSFNDAYEIAKKIFPDEDYWAGECESNIGNAYFSLAENQYEGGQYSPEGKKFLAETKKYWEKCLARALASSEQLKGNTRIPQLASAYNNMGSLMRVQKKYDEALGFFNKSLKIYLRLSFGQEDRMVGLLYGNIGGVYYRMRDYENALIHNQKSVEVMLKTGSQGHLYLVNSYNGIGVCYDRLKEHDEAIKYYKKALSVCLKELGNSHPKTAICFENLGSLSVDMEEWDTAIEYYEKALRIKLDDLGENNPQVISLREKIFSITEQI